MMSFLPGICTVVVFFFKEFIQFSKKCKDFFLFLFFFLSSSFLLLFSLPPFFIFFSLANISQCKESKKVISSLKSGGSAQIIHYIL